MTEENKAVNEDLVEEFNATKGMNKLYLSGPMTGVENFNHELFNRVAAEFRMVGFEVCSPSEFFDGDTTREREDYMREAFKYLLEADTVVILPGWEQSKGARIEITVAQELGLNLVEYVEPDENQPIGGILTPVEEDGNFGSFAPVEETAPDNA
jgi:hypothetical protein